VAAVADASGCDGFLRTPLHVAAEQQAAGPVLALLAAGADVHARDDERGDTPLRACLRNDGEQEQLSAAPVEALLP
jgi:ankyrin repeat protein